MDQPAAPEQDRINGLIGQAAMLAIWLANELRRRLVPPQGVLLETRLLRHLARHYLLPAEAAVRRALHLIAAGMTLPLPTPRAARPAANRPMPKPEKPKAPRPPAFRLMEPQPRPKTDHIPARYAPRITLLTPGTPLSPKRRAPPRQRLSYEERLRRRFAALEDALASPARHASRLARLKPGPAGLSRAFRSRKFRATAPNPSQTQAAPHSTPSMMSCWRLSRTLPTHPDTDQIHLTPTGRRKPLRIHALHPPHGFTSARLQRQP